MTAEVDLSSRLFTAEIKHCLNSEDLPAMRHLQTMTVWCGILLVVAINLAPDLLYKGMEHPVGAEAVRVFQSSATDHEFDQPVWRSEAMEGIVDTGERVQVFLRTDYRDAHLLAKPNLTLLVVGFSILMYFLVGTVRWVASVQRRRME